MRATQPLDASETTLSLPQAIQTWRQWQALAKALIAPLMRPSETPDFADQIGSLGKQVAALSGADPDVAIFHMIHSAQEHDLHYGVSHALHTAVLMALIGRRKDWGDARTATGVKAALTMNLAVTELQNQLACQSTPLSPSQREAIAGHPLASAELLASLGVHDEEWLQAVRQHHEQADGKGYPLGVHELSPLADALHTCDVFGAKMSPRMGRPSMPSPKAASDIFRQRSAGYFGATIIREMGLYPPGCRVLLRTGEHAVVLRRTADSQRPDVAVLSDAQGQSLAQAWHCHAMGPRSIASALPVQASVGHFQPEHALRADLLV